VPVPCDVVSSFESIAPGEVSFAALIVTAGM
jgi:hypothetical protein